VLTGAGLFDIDVNTYGDFYNNAVITVANLEYDSGSLAGTGTFNVSKSFTWTGGDILSCVFLKR
jgi:hypothetical protein